MKTIGQDSTGKILCVGDTVRFRGQLYTLKEFGSETGAAGTPTLFFEEPLHVDEIPDEISVDLVSRRSELDPEAEAWLKLNLELAAARRHLEDKIGPDVVIVSVVPALIVVRKRQP